MKNLIQKTGELLFRTFMVLTGVWIAFALTFQLYGVYLVLSHQEEEMSRIATSMSHKLDGTFKNDPENIWYKK
jgi:hypothetical protein